MVVGYTSCQNVTVGWLTVEYASYVPDTMVVRKALLLEPREISNPEYERWLSLGLPAEIIESMGIPKMITVPGEDYDRDRLDIPWASVPIEGVDGTAPIYVTIKKIETSDGDVERMKAELMVRGDGTFMLPVHNQVPPGRYVISLTFTNEGYSKDVDDCFTIIVK